MHAFDIYIFQDKVSSKMTGYQTYALIKNVFKPDQYVSFLATERNSVFSWINIFPWLSYSRWENGAYYLQCFIWCHVPNHFFFPKPYRDWRHALKSFRNYQSVPWKMHQYCMSTYNEFLQEYYRKSWFVSLGH